MVTTSIELGIDTERMSCKHCGSGDIRKNGPDKFGSPRWHCKACGHYFKANQGRRDGNELHRGNGVKFGNRERNIWYGLGCALYENCFTCPLEPNACIHGKTKDNMTDVIIEDKQVEAWLSAEVKGVARGY